MIEINKEILTRIKEERLLCFHYLTKEQQNFVLIYKDSDQFVQLINKIDEYFVHFGKCWTPRALVAYQYKMQDYLRYRDLHVPPILAEEPNIDHRILDTKNL